ncbi:response regulator [bacterium]|nr:response regulator [candidate division CSSED10-310 bacterium]
MIFKLMLADRSVTIQKVIQLTFSHPNYAVAVAADTEAFNLLLKEEAPDILLLDTGFFGDDLQPALEKLRDAPEGRYVHTILMIRPDDDVSIEKVRDLGISDFVFKPLDNRELSMKIHQRLMSMAGRLRGESDEFVEKRGATELGSGLDQSFPPFPLASIAHMIEQLATRLDTLREQSAVPVETVETSGRQVDDLRTWLEERLRGLDTPPMVDSQRLETMMAEFGKSFSAQLDSLARQVDEVGQASVAAAPTGLSAQVAELLQLVRELSTRTPPEDASNVKEPVRDETMNDMRETLESSLASSSRIIQEAVDHLQQSDEKHASNYQNVSERLDALTIKLRGVPKGDDIEQQLRMVVDEIIAKTERLVERPGGTADADHDSPDARQDRFGELLSAVTALRESSETIEKDRREHLAGVVDGIVAGHVDRLGKMVRNELPGQVRLLIEESGKEVIERLSRTMATGINAVIRSALQKDDLRELMQVERILEEVNRVLGGLASEGAVSALAERQEQAAATIDEGFRNLTAFLETQRASLASHTPGNGSGSGNGSGTGELVVLSAKMDAVLQRLESVNRLVEELETSVVTGGVQELDLQKVSEQLAYLISEGRAGAGAGQSEAMAGEELGKLLRETLQAWEGPAAFDYGLLAQTIAERLSSTGVGTSAAGLDEADTDRIAAAVAGILADGSRSPEGSEGKCLDLIRERLEDRLDALTAAVEDLVKQPDAGFQTAVGDVVEQKTALLVNSINERFDSLERGVNAAAIPGPELDQEGMIAALRQGIREELGAMEPVGSSAVEVAVPHLEDEEAVRTAVDRGINGAMQALQEAMLERVSSAFKEHLLNLIDVDRILARADEVIREFAREQVPKITEQVVQMELDLLDTIDES